jgi:hypothetical protein
MRHFAHDRVPSLPRNEDGVEAVPWAMVANMDRAASANPPSGQLAYPSVVKA